jgi:hypothetical protein
MIAEPYICIKGPRNKENCEGLIKWYAQHSVIPVEVVYLSKDGSVMQMLDGSEWKRYADFEREKMKQFNGRMNMGWVKVIVFGYEFGPYLSSDLIDYWGSNYLNDSESNRLLKRAEFLKAVCEKEGVGWMPALSPLQSGELWMGDNESDMKEVGKIKNIKFKYAPDGKMKSFDIEMQPKRFADLDDEDKERLRAAISEMDGPQEVKPEPFAIDCSHLEPGVIHEIFIDGTKVATIICNVRITPCR